MNFDRKLIRFAAALAAGAFIAVPAHATDGGSGGSAASGSASSGSSSGAASGAGAAGDSAASSGTGNATGTADGSPFPGTGAASTAPSPDANASLRAGCFDNVTNQWRATPECAAFAGTPVPSPGETAYSSAAPGYSSSAAPSSGAELPASSARLGTTQEGRPYNSINAPTGTSPSTLPENTTPRSTGR